MMKQSFEAALFGKNAGDFCRISLDNDETEEPVSFPNSKFSLTLGGCETRLILTERHCVSCERAGAVLKAHRELLVVR